MLAFVALVLLVGCNTSVPRDDSVAAPENASAIVDAVIDAYGGGTALQRLEAFRIEASLQAHIRGFTGALRRDFRAPDHYLVEIGYPEGSEVRILAGAKAWRGNERVQTPAAGPPRQAMVYQLVRATVPWSLDHYRDQLNYLGEGVFEGRDCYLLSLHGVEGISMHFWVDAERLFVTRVQGNFTAGPMMLEFATEYADFREVEGVMVPFREENYANGNHTGTTTLHQVTFEPADLGPFLPASGLTAQAP